MTKRTAKTKSRKTKAVKARKVVKARKAVRARKIARKARTAQPNTVFKQPLTALQNGVSSFISYFK